MDVLIALFSDHTLRTVAMGAGVIGAVAGVLGAFAMLRRQSLAGDAISHAALPGVALAFLIGGAISGGFAKHPLNMLAGAFIAGWIGMLVVAQIARTTRIKTDTAMGIVLSVFFGLGLLLMSIIQELPTAAKAGLDKYLFGSAAAMLKADVATMATIGLVVLVVLVLLWKEFKLLCFDTEYMAVQGWPVRTLDIAITTLIVLAIVIGLQTVGVVLISALLVAPAAAARQWSNQLGPVALLAGMFGALSGVIGAVLSSTVDKLSTGPTVVLAASAFAVLSLLFAPARGMVWDHLRHVRQHREVKEASVLVGLYRLASMHADPAHPHDVSSLDAVGIHAAKNTMGQLSRHGYVKAVDGKWGLTKTGFEKARKLAEEGAKT